MHLNVYFVANKILIYLIMVYFLLNSTEGFEMIFTPIDFFYRS